MYNYVLDGDVGKKELVFNTQEDVFYPTDTSNLLIEACKLSISRPKRILDLGCGCGVVGIVLAKLGLCNGPIFASDLSDNAISLAKRNASKMSVNYIARCGSLFEPWKNEKFDLIVDDVSGISDDIAKISWYPDGVDCNAGRDGTKWINQIIEQSKNYLIEGGVFIFPVLSLSNAEKILQAVKKTYSSYEQVIKKDWFLPEEITSKIGVLMPLINDGSIKCEKKFGKWLWSTYIFRAHN